MSKVRLDSALAERGMFSSRTAAAASVRAGEVRVGLDGPIALKPSQLVSADAELLVDGPRRYVSRGGVKLENALRKLPVAVTGHSCLDVGASTGGFTDCLLQRGAASVTALDVGHGQLHPRIRQDPRVEVVERVNIRTVAPGQLGRPFNLVVADLSFISLTVVAPPLVAVAAEGTDLVVLVKPQFEVGRAEASRAKGVIRDPDLWRQALHGVATAFAAAGAAPLDACRSPVRGAQGNVEFLLHLRRGGTAGTGTAGIARTAGAAGDLGAPDLYAVHES